MFFFACALILIGLGFRDAWPPDEPRFALVAKEMVNSGQWLVPMRGGEIYPDKPPVFMWCIAFFYLITGSLKVAMLLPNAIASLVTLGLTYNLSLKLASEKAAMLSMLALLLSPQFLIQAKFAQIDALVACFVWIGVCGFIQHFYVRVSWRWYFTAWILMGLGIITKGVGFLPILLFIPIAFFAFTSGLHRGQWSLRMLFGPLIMLSVVAMWLAPLLYLGLIKQEPQIQQYLSNILFKQTAERYANAWHHIEPWYYYIVEVIPVFWITPVAILLSKAKWLRNVLTQNPAYSSLLIWVILVVIFFSISPGKRGVYVLPALPALSMIAGLVLANSTVSRGLALFSRAVTSLISGALLIAGLALLFHEPIASKLITRFDSDSETLVRLSMLLLVLGFAGLCTHIVYYLYNKNRNAVEGKSLAYQLLSWLFILTVIPSTFGAWLLNDYRTPRIVLQNAESQIDNMLTKDSTAFEVGIVSFKEQYLLFSPFQMTHFGYHIPKELENGTAWAWLTDTSEPSRGLTKASGQRISPPIPQRFLLVPNDYKFQCVDLSQATSLGIAHRDEWLLLPASAANATCDLPTNGPVFNSYKGSSN
nr:glycosyltransferase family 39 protein [Alteromonas sp. IB21]